jgi:hypothetical protein
VATLAPFIRNIERQQQMFAPTLRLVNSPTMRAMRRHYADLERNMEILRLAQRAMATHQMILRGLPPDIRALYFSKPRTDFTPVIPWFEELAVEEATSLDIVEETEIPDQAQRSPTGPVTPRQMDDLIIATIITIAMSIFFISLRYPKVGVEIAFAGFLAEVGKWLFEYYKRER